MITTESRRQVVRRRIMEAFHVCKVDSAARAPTPTPPATISFLTHIIRSPQADALTIGRRSRALQALHCANVEREASCFPISCSDRSSSARFPAPLSHVDRPDGGPPH